MTSPVNFSQYLNTTPQEPSISPIKPKPIYVFQSSRPSTPPSPGSPVPLSAERVSATPSAADPELSSDSDTESFTPISPAPSSFPPNSFVSPKKGKLLGTVEVSPKTHVKAYDADQALLSSPIKPKRLKSPINYHSPDFFNKEANASVEVPKSLERIFNRREMRTHTFMPKQEQDAEMETLKKALSRSSTQPLFAKASLFEIDQPLNRNFITVHKTKKKSHQAFPVAGNKCIQVPGSELFPLYKKYLETNDFISFDYFLHQQIKNSNPSSIPSLLQTPAPSPSPSSATPTSLTSASASPSTSISTTPSPTPNPSSSLTPIPFAIPAPSPSPSPISSSQNSTPSAPLKLHLARTTSSLDEEIDNISRSKRSRKEKREQALTPARASSISSILERMRQKSSSV